MSRLQKNRLTLLGIALFSAITLTALSPTDSYAAYDGGNIIDNQTFLNTATMDAAAIQNFLTSKGSGLATKYFLFDCDATDVSATYYRNAGAPCGQTVLASQLIYYAAQIYGINPQVVLATIQKEQSLVTTANPTQTQLNFAMGYGCPTGGSCASSNFLYQIDNGTWVKRLHMERARGNMTWWYPASSWVCGTTKNFYKPNLYPNQNVDFYDEDNVYYRTHYISNAATSSHYCYTPHAYNNPQGLYGLPKYGTAGRYYSGSYNFVSAFESWFGPTTGSPFFQLPGSVSTYVYGANNSYYAIADYKRLLDYGFISRFEGRLAIVNQATLNGMTYKGLLPPIARFEGAGVFVPQDGSLLPFTDEQTFYAFGYKFGDEATLPAWMGTMLRTGDAMRQVVQSSDSPTMYYIQAGKKQPFCNWEVFTTTGSPVYSTQPAVRLKSSYTDTISIGQPIARDGDLIASADGSAYGVYLSGRISPIPTDIAQATGAINCAVPKDSYLQIPQTTPITNLVKDTNGVRYILDSGKRFRLSDTVYARIGIADTQYATVSPLLLNRINSVVLNDVIRQGKDTGVYLLQDGKRFGIALESDFYGLGYNFSQVTSVNNHTFNLLQYGGTIAKPGRVIRINNDRGVYLIDTNFNIYGFPTEDMFLGYGYSWSDVVSVSPDYIAAYKSAGTVSKFVRDFHNNVLLIDSGKHAVIPPSITGVNGFALDIPSLPQVTDNTINRSTASPSITGVVRAQNDRGVYVIEAGRKRVFASESALFAHGYTWQHVQVFSPSFVGSIPTGDPIFQ